MGGADSSAGGCDWTAPEGALSSPLYAAYVSPSCGGAACVEYRPGPSHQCIGPHPHGTFYRRREQRRQSLASLTLAINTRPTRINFVWHNGTFQSLHPRNTPFEDTSWTPVEAHGHPPPPNGRNPTRPCFSDSVKVSAILIGI